MRPDPIAFTGTPRASGRPIFAKASGRAFNSRTEAGATIIDIFDEIGLGGIDTADLEAQLRGAADVVVRLNSPGGDVFAGLAMFNLLASHPGNVRIEVLGVAASAASLIAMAGDTIAMAANSHLMIHSAWTIALGNAVDLDKTADVLRQVDGSLAETYAARSGQPLATIKRMLADETWLTADQAVAAGLADEKLEAATPRARFDLSTYAKAPAELRGAIDTTNPTTRDVETVLRNAGFSRSQARTLAEEREADEIAELAAHINAASLTL